MTSRRARADRRRSRPVSADPREQLGLERGLRRLGPLRRAGHVHDPGAPHAQTKSRPGSTSSSRARRWMSQRPPVRRNSPGRAGAGGHLSIAEPLEALRHARIETPGRSARPAANTNGVPWAASRSSRAAVRVAQSPTPPAAADHPGRHPHEGDARRARHAPPGRHASSGRSARAGDVRPSPTPATPEPTGLTRGRLHDAEQPEDDDHEHGDTQQVEAYSAHRNTPLSNVARQRGPALHRQSLCPPPLREFFARRRASGAREIGR